MKANLSIRIAHGLDLIQSLLAPSDHERLGDQRLLSQQ
jgi:hypothetical protein